MSLPAVSSNGPDGGLQDSGAGDGGAAAFAPNFNSTMAETGSFVFTPAAFNSPVLGRGGDGGDFFSVFGSGGRSPTRPDAPGLAGFDSDDNQGAGGDGGVSVAATGTLEFDFKAADFKIGNADTLGISLEQEDTEEEEDGSQETEGVPWEGKELRNEERDRHLTEVADANSEGSADMEEEGDYETATRNLEWGLDDLERQWIDRKLQLERLKMTRLKEDFEDYKARREEVYRDCQRIWDESNQEESGKVVDVADGTTLVDSAYVSSPGEETDEEYGDIVDRAHSFCRQKSNESAQDAALDMTVPRWR